MTTLIAPQPFAIGPRQVFRSGKVLLRDPQTATLTLHVAKPTEDDLGFGTEGGDPVGVSNVVWSSETQIRTTIHLEAGREAHKVTSTSHGGPVIARRRYKLPVQHLESGLTWTLPHGFGERRTGFPERIGQNRAACSAWVEIECLHGPGLKSAVSLEAGTGKPSYVQHHSSVGYQNSSSVSEVSGGDGQLSLSFTAGVGTDRVAFVFGGTSRDTRPTAASVTFAGGIDQDLGDATNTFWRGAGGLAWDTRISSGAQTVAFASSGGSGSQYSTLLAVISVTGAHQTTHGTAVTAGADSGTALSITVSSPAADSLVVDIWTWVQDSATDPVAGASQTPRSSSFADEAGNVEGWVVTSTQAGADGGVMTWTKAASDWEYVGMAIELKAAAAAGGTPKGIFDNPFSGPFGGPI